MDRYVSYQAEIDDAWRSVEARVEMLPPSLAAVGRRLLSTLSVADAAHPLCPAGEACPPLLLLPLWLRDRFRQDASLIGSRVSDADQAVVAGVWGALHVRIQGELLADGEDFDRDRSLFSNVCCAEMFASLQVTTAGDRGFRAAFDRAWTAFSWGALEERRHLSGTDIYQADLFAAYAQKSSFARVPALAVCFAAGRPDLEAPVSALVQHLSVAFGLMNDVLGWQRDLQSRRWTYLLARAGLTPADVAAYGAPSSAEPATLTARLDRRLHRVLHDEGLLYEMSEEALRWLRRAAAAGAPLGLPDLTAYTEERTRWIRSVRRRLQAPAPQPAPASHRAPLSYRAPISPRRSATPRALTALPTGTGR